MNYLSQLLRQLRDQLFTLWNSAKPIQRIFILTGFSLILILLLIAVYSTTSTNYVVLYNPETMPNISSDEIKTYLDQAQIPYKIRDKSIFIPKDSEQQVRMQLAINGPKAPVSKGYELFDSSTWIKGEKEMQILELRALKGQLEYDISQFDNIRSANLILDLPSQRPFGGPNTQAKASVILQLRPGARLSTQELRAITFHIAGAVRGLSPNMIAISDTTGKLYQSIDPDGNFDFIRNAELAAEEHLKAKIDGMLATVLGFNHSYSTVQVSMKRDKATEEKKTFTGTVDGFDLGAPVIRTVSESSDRPTTQQMGRSNEKKEMDPKTAQFLQMAVPVDHIKIATNPGKIETISATVLIDDKILASPGLRDKKSLKEDIEHQIATMLKGYDAQIHYTVNFIKFDPSAYATPPALPSEQLVKMPESNAVTLLITIIMITVLGILWLLLDYFKQAKLLAARKTEKSTLAKMAERKTLADLEDVLNAIKTRLEQSNPMSNGPKHTKTHTSPVKEILKNEDIVQLASYLSQESNQTVALMLFYLEPERSSQILKEMTYEKQCDIIASMAVIEDLDAETIQELIKTTAETMGDTSLEYGMKLVESYKATAEIIAKLSSNEQKILLANLDKKYAAVAAKISRMLEQEKG